MKYVVILGDGMADVPLDKLNNKTPLDAAKKPYIDMLCKKGQIGLVRTVPGSLPPGSDVANLSVMGYNPLKYYTGRSPLEAVSMGIEVLPTDTTFRTNVVTLSNEENYEDKKMVDYSSGEITTAESRELLKYIDEKLGTDILHFYGGISYRHLLVWNNLSETFKLTPPHDISGKTVKEFLPNNEILLDIMKKSYELLSEHPINKERIKKGLNPANSLWFWGQGKKPKLTSFEEKFGVKGAVISAVDLVKGIGICADMQSIDVAGATGNIDTNFDGKAKACIEALKNNDFVYIHMEAPDECGHHFDAENKKLSIELIDSIVVKQVYEYLESINEDYKILIMPDHPTPCNIGTHTSNPVPFVIYESNNEKNCGLVYNEENAKNSGIFVENGFNVMEEFIKG